MNKTSNLPSRLARKIVFNTEKVCVSVWETDEMPYEVRTANSLVCTFSLPPTPTQAHTHTAV